MGANVRERFSTKAGMKPVLFLQKSPNISGTLGEFTGECSLGSLYSSSLLLGRLYSSSLLLGRLYSSCPSRKTVLQLLPRGGAGAPEESGSRDALDNRGAKHHAPDLHMYIYIYIYICTHIHTYTHIFSPSGLSERS